MKVVFKRRHGQNARNGVGTNQQVLSHRNDSLDGYSKSWPK